MSKSIFSAVHFNDEAAAYAYVEARLWPDGPVCPHCGVIDRAGRLKGKTGRPGLWKCYACRKPFTVKIGTIFEASHIPMRDWLVAIHLICSSKKGISSNQLARTLGLTVKSAWFMSHRIREAMAEAPTGPLGGSGSTIEADETYFGGRRRGKNAKGVQHGIHDKMKVFALVERGGKARSFKVDNVTAQAITPLLTANADRASHLRTDEAKHYRRVGREFASHEAIHHALEEYGRGDVHTNTIEGFFSIFKRGMKGVYQHCRQDHLHRYLAEFDFRYNNRVKLGVDDLGRADGALKGVVGKRLTYRTTDRHAEI